jgi:hypothetical protein
MDVTAEHVARVPAQNLRVARERFGDVWARAEAALSGPGPDDHYLWGVVCTCRWLAGTAVPTPWTASGWESPESPVRDLRVSAHPEVIEEEYASAVRYRRSRVPAVAGKARGTLATLEWAWHSSGPSPLDVVGLAAG